MSRSRRTPSIAPTFSATGDVSPNQLGHRILQQIRQRILNWSYPPGHHLGEPELSEEFAASRVPVREALRALVEQGLVEKVPNQGCFVRQPDAQATHHLYDLRLALELFVVERLARAGLPSEWLTQERAHWEPWLNIRADAPVDGELLVRMDEQFHVAMARALGNPYIVDSMRDINDRLRFVRLVVVTTPHRIQTTAGEHLAILDAIAQRDTEAARRAIRQNLHHARNQIEIAISQALSRAHGQRSPNPTDEPLENPFRAPAAATSETNPPAHPTT
ncbi:MAG: GntR family transcriptional regulator [Verrucomicrobia bacterium]|nr:GntR family transcriptional regulator [Verrucomicrobiota bacterium]